MKYRLYYGINPKGNDEFTCFVNDENEAEPSEAPEYTKLLIETDDIEAFLTALETEQHRIDAERVK